MEWRTGTARLQSCTRRVPQRLRQRATYRERSTESPLSGNDPPNKPMRDQEKPQTKNQMKATATKQQTDSNGDKSAKRPDRGNGTARSGYGASERHKLRIRPSGASTPNCQIRSPGELLLSQGQIAAILIGQHMQCTHQTNMRCAKDNLLSWKNWPG